MTTMTAHGATDNHPPTGEERRKYHEVRAIFEEAIEVIQPFFDPANAWGNRSLDHLAYRSVREHYPQLSMEEVHVLVVAAKRVFAERRAGHTRD